MEGKPEEYLQKSLKIRVRIIRAFIIVIEIVILAAFVIGIMTNTWNPSSGTILFLLVCMMIPLIFLITPENPHDD